MRGVRSFGPRATGLICALILLSGADPLPPSLSWTGEAVAQVCDCPCHGDPVCDGLLNVVDVIRVIDVGFRMAPPTFDPLCAFSREDVNCDAGVTVFDLLKMILVVFRGEDPVIEFCDPNPIPCSEILDPGLCHPAIPTPNNSVVVESKTVSAGATGVQVGVYVENSFDLTAIVLPFEIRTVTGGAYMAGTYDLAPQGRVAASGLMDFPSTVYYDTPEVGNPCGGPVSQSYRVGAAATASAPSDAVTWAGINSQTPCLAPGFDGVPGVGTPSFLFTFDIGPSEGTFEIDTCCVMPANHTVFAECGTDNCLLPFFTKGVITVEPVCPCPCHGDPVCDGLTNIVDLVRTVDVAFRDVPPTFDPPCPVPRGDVWNCDGIVSVLDVVAMYNVVIRGLDPATEFCDPNPEPCSEVLDPGYCEPDVPTPGNAVVVESRQVPRGATGVEVGIYVTNVIDVTALVLPLEIREVSGGAYMAGSFDLRVQGRVGSSGLMDNSATGVYNTPSGNVCSGPVSQSYSGRSSAPGVPSAPTDAIIWQGANSLGACLGSGTDGSPGTGTPSFVLTFDVADIDGTFEIDTCCVTPANHLVFAECGTSNCVLPAFVKGLIIVDCACDCAADPQCDGETNIFDLVHAAAVGMRNEPDMPDPNPFCPRMTTDVNCDGVTNIFDLVHLSAVGMRNEDPALNFCDPCPVVRR